MLPAVFMRGGTSKALMLHPRDVRGQISALVFAVAALSVSAFALWLGQPWVAGTIGGGTIAPLVGAFLYQRVTAKKALPQTPGHR